MFLKTLFSITLSFVLTSVLAQYNYSERDLNLSSDTIQNESLYLNFHSYSFFKNNEYFGDYIEGYTMPGYILEPTFLYNSVENIKIRAGLNAIYYAGTNHFSAIMPIVSIEAPLTRNLNVVLGSLKGNVAHKMTEPIFDSENQYFRPVETGVQFLYADTRLKVDLWLDWEQFILHGDSIPEKFTNGLNANYHLSKMGKWDVTVPFQWVIIHRGGQISDFKESMITLANTMTGLTFSRSFDHGRFVKNISFNGHFLSFKTVTGETGLPFRNGYGWYPSLHVEAKKGRVMLGYWNSRNFASPKGNYEFQSVSNYNADIHQINREMITLKGMYRKVLSEKAVFSISTEAYYDMPAAQLEYSYGFHLLYKPTFLLRKWVD